MAEEESVWIQQAEESVSDLDTILDAFAAELALERELGTRSFEIDRELLKPGLPRGVAPRNDDTPPQPSLRGDAEAIRVRSYDFVFLHEKALLPKAIEVMAKIITAMNKTAETAPLVITGDLPPAKMYIVLGDRALKFWFPEQKARPGTWLRTNQGAPILVTYTPEDFVRFSPVPPAVQQQKKAMWASLKDLMKRLETT